MGDVSGYINRYSVSFDFPRPHLAPSGYLQPSAMERSQSFQGNAYATIERQLLKGGTISIGRVMNSVPGNMDGSGPQQVPYRPTTGYLLEPLPSSTSTNSYMDVFSSRENGGSLHSVSQSILWPPILADVLCPRHLRQSILTHRQLHRTNTTPRPSYKINGMARNVKKDYSMVSV
jgi:hypothetical protein